MENKSKHWRTGKFCEYRAKNWMSKIMNWRVFKTNKAIDKYCQIDFIAINKRHEKLYIQVKSISQINRLIDLTKAKNKAIKDECRLYLMFVEPKIDGKVYLHLVV